MVLLGRRISINEEWGQRQPRTQDSALSQQQLAGGGLRPFQAVEVEAGGRRPTGFVAAIPGHSLSA